MEASSARAMASRRATTVGEVVCFCRSHSRWLMRPHHPWRGGPLTTTCPSALIHTELADTRCPRPVTSNCGETGSPDMRLLSACRRGRGRSVPGSPWIRVCCRSSHCRCDVSRTLASPARPMEMLSPVIQTTETEIMNPFPVMSHSSVPPELSTRALSATRRSYGRSRPGSPATTYEMSVMDPPIRTKTRADHPHNNASSCSRSNGEIYQKNRFLSTGPLLNRIFQQNIQVSCVRCTVLIALLTSHRVTFFPLGALR